ncbi:MAG: hypothetical protein ACKOGA_04010, partial [Planctomycetaceae bacterium]
WLLRQWGGTAQAEEVERTEVKYAPGREWYTEVVEVQPESEDEGGEKPPKQKIAMTFWTYPRIVGAWLRLCGLLGLER